VAIKGGDLIHIGNQILIDRAQTAGPGQVDINVEKIYELGNYQSIGQIRDTPDLTFSLDSYDASMEFEAALCGVDFTAMADGDSVDLAKSLPMDVASQFKPGIKATDAYDTVGSVAIPYLTLQQVQYAFGISDDAKQSATLKGDGCYYSDGSTYIETFVGTGVAGQIITLAHDALVYNGDTTSGARYAISVSLVSAGQRLTFGPEYTETLASPANGGTKTKAVTITLTNAVPVTEKIRVIYASDTVAVYPQSAHEPVTAVRPAAIRGRNIECFVGGTAISDRWTSVQQVQITWSVTLDKDEELGNPNVVSQDFDVPDVSGSIDLKPRDYAELYAKVCQIADVTPGEVAGPLTTAPLDLVLVLHSPDTGEVLKTIEIPDARFTFPGFSGQVQQKLTVTMNWTSDTGAMTLYKGAKPSA
jgi:hypothetical protein